MRAHWRHTSTTTHKYHLCIGVFGKELTKGAVHRNLVTWLQAKHIGRHLPRHNTSRPWRWCGNTNIKLNHALFVGIVGHGVSTNHCFINNRLMLKEIKALPITAVLCVDIEVSILNMVRRTFQLHITTRAESNIFSLGQR